MVLGGAVFNDCSATGDWGAPGWHAVDAVQRCRTGGSGPPRLPSAPPGSHGRDRATSPRAAGCWQGEGAGRGVLKGFKPLLQD